MAIRPADYMGHRTGSYQNKKQRNKRQQQRENRLYSVWHGYQPLTAEEWESARQYQKQKLGLQDRNNEKKQK